MFQLRAVDAAANELFGSRESPAAAVPRHLPATHLSPVVQLSPSSQVPLAMSVHAVALCAGVHTWHGFTGFFVPAEKHWKLMAQVPACGA